MAADRFVEGKGQRKLRRRIKNICDGNGSGNEEEWGGGNESNNTTSTSVGDNAGGLATDVRLAMQLQSLITALSSVLTEAVGTLTVTQSLDKGEVERMCSVKVFGVGKKGGKKRRKGNSAVDSGEKHTPESTILSSSVLPFIAGKSKTRVNDLVPSLTSALLPLLNDDPSVDEVIKECLGNTEVSNSGHVLFKTGENHELWNDQQQSSFTILTRNPTSPSSPPSS